MYRPLLIVAAFIAVTFGLIFLQPDRSGQMQNTPTVAQPTETVPATKQAPAPETTIASTSPVISLRPQARPVKQPEDATIEVTRAPAPALLTPPAAPIVADIPASATPETDLFSDHTENRPNLLTATVRDKDGRMAPSLKPLADAGRVSLETLETAPLDHLPTDVASAATQTPATVQNTTSDLRAKLAAVPTRAVHTVRLGDSLHTLALRYYGDPSKSKIILEANRRLITDGTSLTIGQILRIPDITNL